MFSSFALSFNWFSSKPSSNTKRLIELPPVPVCDSEAAAEKATKTLKHFLKANHANFAIIYHNLRYHNHTPHILGSAHILGANGDQLTKIYDVETEHLEPWTPSPSEITKDDWSSFLGQRQYQRAYVDFFEDQLVAHAYDWKALLESFLYDDKAPLFSALVSGLGHPLIHLGYAYELNSKDIAVEALGLAACFYDDLHKYTDDPSYTKPSPLGPKSTLELLQQLSKDDRLNNLLEGEDEEANIAMLLDKKEDVVLEYWNAWTVGEGRAKDMFEESQQTAVAALVAGRTDGSKYDFFLVHALTTSHAMRILLPIIPADRQLSLVRQWWMFALLAYVSQGRPALDMSRIDDFDVQGKGWKDAVDLALTSSHAQDAHYVKGVRAMKNAAETWGDESGYFLKAGLKFSQEFSGWGA